jgi:hypothetical protein
LRVSFLGKGHVFARLNLGAFPRELDIIVVGFDQLPRIADAAFDQRSQGLADLPADFPVGTFYMDQRGWGLMDYRRLVCHKFDYKPTPEKPQGSVRFMKYSKKWGLPIFAGFLPSIWL